MQNHLRGENRHAASWEDGVSRHPPLPARLPRLQDHPHRVWHSCRDPGQNRAPSLNPPCCFLLPLFHLSQICALSPPAAYPLKLDVVLFVQKGEVQVTEETAFLEIRSHCGSGQRRTSRSLIRLHRLLICRFLSHPFSVFIKEIQLRLIQWRAFSVTSAVKRRACFAARIGASEMRRLRISSWLPRGALIESINWPSSTRGAGLVSPGTENSGGQHSSIIAREHFCYLSF